jgi:hypothetical protein
MDVETFAIIEQQAASGGGGGVETAKRHRAVLRQYSIEFVYFFNHCDLSGCSNVYGWVVLPKKAHRR